MLKSATIKGAALALLTACFMNSSALAAVPINGNASPIIGEAFEGKITFFGAPADVPTAHYEVFSGSLPDGLSLDPATGIVSGTATKPGQFEATIRLSENGQLKYSSSFRFWVSVTQTITLSTANFSKAGDQVIVNFTMPFASKPPIVASDGEVLPTTFTAAPHVEECTYRISYLDCEYRYTYTEQDVSKKTVRFETPRGTYRVAHDDGRLWNDNRMTNVSTTSQYEAAKPNIIAMPGQRLEFTTGQTVDVKLGWHPMMTGSGIPQGIFTLAPNEAKVADYGWSGTLPAGLVLAPNGQLTGTLLENPVEDYIFYIVGDTQAAGNPLYLLPFIVTIKAAAVDTGNGGNGSGGDKPKFVFRVTNYSTAASY